MSERLSLKMCKFVSVVWSVPFGPSNEKYVDHGVGFATPGPAATLWSRHRIKSDVTQFRNIINKFRFDLFRLAELSASSDGNQPVLLRHASEILSNLWFFRKASAGCYIDSILNCSSLGARMMGTWRLSKTYRRNHWNLKENGRMLYADMLSGLLPSVHPCCGSEDITCLLYDGAEELNPREGHTV